MNIYDFTTAELEVEIEKRKNEKPEMLENPNFHNLKRNVRAHIDAMWSDYYCDDNDDSHYIYEEAITAFYGDEVWDKINRKLK